MFLSYDESNPNAMSLPEAFVFEEMTSQLFFSDLSDNSDQALGDGNTALSVSVAVRGTTLHEQESSGGKSRRTVNAIVSCSYLSDGYPVDLDTALMYSVNISALSYPNVELDFRPYESWKVLSMDDDFNSMTAADRGLVVAVVGLSVTLLAVSAVLLHVTGGWAACRQRVGNCLFEEIDEDEGHVYPQIDHKGTFRVDDDATSAYDGGDNEQQYGGGGYIDHAVVNGMGGAMLDDQSVETGMTNPSGVLGVQHRDGGDKTIAAGLGIQSPEASRDGYAMSRYGNDTPVSTSDRPLGIASMRDQQDDAAAYESKGLAHMIMERLNHYSGSKK
jgi:hypothetical protein